MEGLPGSEHNVRAHLKNKVEKKLGRVLYEDELAEHRENTNKCFRSDEFRRKGFFLTPCEKAAKLGWHPDRMVSFGVLKQRFHDEQEEEGEDRCTEGGSGRNRTVREVNNSSVSNEEHSTVEDTVVDTVGIPWWIPWWIPW